MASASATRVGRQHRAAAVRRNARRSLVQIRNEELGIRNSRPPPRWKKDVMFIEGMVDDRLRLSSRANATFLCHPERRWSSLCRRSRRRSRKRRRSRGIPRSSGSVPSGSFSDLLTPSGRRDAPSPASGRWPAIPGLVHKSLPPAGSRVLRLGRRTASLRMTEVPKPCLRRRCLWPCRRRHQPRLRPSRPRPLRPRPHPRPRPRSLPRFSARRCRE